MTREKLLHLMGIGVKDPTPAMNTACVSGLIELYHRQTADEKDASTTVHENGMGFNGADAYFLSSLAAQAIERRRARAAGEVPAHWTDLSPKQLACLRKNIAKYVGQLVDIAEEKAAARAAKAVPSEVHAAIERAEEAVDAEGMTQADHEAAIAARVHAETGYALPGLRTSQDRDAARIDAAVDAGRAVPYVPPVERSPVERSPALLSPDTTRECQECEGKGGFWVDAPRGTSRRYHGDPDWADCGACGGAGVVPGGADDAHEEEETCSRCGEPENACRCLEDDAEELAGWLDAREAPAADPKDVPLKGLVEVPGGWRLKTAAEHMVESPNKWGVPDELKGAMRRKFKPSTAGASPSGPFDEFERAMGLDR